MTPEQQAALSFPVPLWPVAPVAPVATIGFIVFVCGVLAYLPDTRVAIVVGAVWLALLAVAYRLWVRPAIRERA